MTDPEKKPAAIRFRRVVVAVIITSFGIAALGGIIVLLGGELGETAGRVLGTTAIVGAFSVAVLCCTSLVGRSLQWFGLVGALIAVVTAVLVLIVVWSGTWPEQNYLRVLWSALTLTVATSFASLLLLLSDRQRTAVRIGLLITLGLFAVTVVMILVLIWVPEVIEADAYPRALGIVAILAALGAVVVPVLSLLMPDTRSQTPRADARDHGAASTMSPALARRLEAEAERRGITVEELVGPVLPD